VLSLRSGGRFGYGQFGCVQFSNALDALWDDDGTALTASNVLGALSDNRTATTSRTANRSPKALGALAVALRDIRRTWLRRILARRDD